MGNGYEGWAEHTPYDAIIVTAFYRNHNYHTSRDTYETLDYERMAMVV